MFSRKGVIIIEKTDDIDEDELMEAALDAGADDMETMEDSFEITTDPSAYNDVDQALRQAGYELVSSELEQVPSVESTPDEKDLHKLKKLVDILEENDDGMIIKGNTIHGGTVSSHNDHRLAMAFSLLGLKHDVEVEDGECFDVSFPNFIESMAEIGVELELE